MYISAADALSIFLCMRVPVYIFLQPALVPFIPIPGPIAKAQFD